jgi:1-acyl-sn-glycerol-3-phosphate acyltransferase
MHYKSIFCLNPGKSRSLFLPEVSVAGLAMKDVGMLKEKVFKMMEEELVKNGAKWVE